MFYARKFVLAAALAPAFAGGVSAASLDAEAIMNGVVAISLGDFTTDATTHVEGPTYVGGNLTSSEFDANGDNMPEFTLGGVTGSLIVGGDMTSNLNSAQNGAVQVGGTFTGDDVGETVYEGVAGIPVAEMVSLFTTLSDDLSGQADTAGASVTGDFNNGTFTSGAGDADGFAYLTLTSAEVDTFLEGQANLSFNVASGVSFIINVPGSFEAGLNELTGKVNNDSPTVLFNFYEATELTFGSNPFNASILSPYADIHSAGGGTNGTVIGATIELGGEIRPFGNTDGYMGDLPTFNVDPTPPAPPAVPLPASVFLLAGALGGLGLTRRVKSRA